MHAFDGHASLEAESVSPVAWKEKTRNKESTFTSVRGERNVAASILAAEVSRFQCVESQEKNGEAKVYAFQSGDAWTGS